MSPDVNFQMSLLVEALVTIGHVALVTFPWLLADLGLLHLERVNTEFTIKVGSFQMGLPW
jgi:hypothetical protein